MKRRNFIKQISYATIGAFFFNSYILGAENKYKAEFYEKLDNNKVRCLLCPNHCILKDGMLGVCRARKNINGDLYSLNYAEVAAIHVDPIEKKPFFHFKPSSLALSLAAPGCNLRCKFCQNWEISQFEPKDVNTDRLLPDDIANYAHKKNLPIIAYTYSEPIIFYEFMKKISESSQDYSLLNVMVSAGFIEKKPLIELLKFLDGIKIDLKAFNNDYYRKICSGRLQPVLDTLLTIKSNNKWLEIVYLVVPSLNDSDTEFKKTAKWIKENLGPDTPLHFSRFYPQYKLRNLPPTPVETIEKACDIAYAEGLHYVYAGNIPGNKYENTYCPKCGSVLIERYGYYILQNNIKDGKCHKCGYTISGVW